jgi:antitoxin component YwqK of YwqJK toxin-antitoxin module
MKYIFILLFLIQASAYSQNKAILSELRESGGIYFLNGKPFTGIGFTMFNENKFRYKINYLNGKRHGKFLKYFENGQIEYNHNYSH